MTVGYKIAGGTDLDAVFLARVSAAAAATGFKDSAGVDLNSRYEPRGSSTPVGDTGFKIAGGTDLAQIFKSISAITATTHSMTAGSYTQPVSGTTHTGFAVAALIQTGSPAFGSISPNTVGGNTVVGMWWSDDDALHINFQAGSTPADTDSTWQSMTFNGTYQGGGSGNRTVTRAGRSATSTTATRRQWDFVGPGFAFASGNIYSVTINRV